MTIAARPTPPAPRLLVIEHEPRTGIGRLADGLRRAGTDLDVRRPDLGGDLPGDLDGYAGLMVMGGSMASWEDEAAPWLPRTRRLLAEAVERRLPALGICLGAQLLALATGGTVERGGAGLEVGLVDVQVTAAGADDALLGPVAAALGPTLAVPQWHQDAVTHLPPGAVLIATADRYPHQAFRLGDSAWGVQYHPEVTADDWASWMDDGHGAVRTEGLHPEEVHAAMLAAEPRLQALAAAHAAAFSAVLAATRR